MTKRESERRILESWAANAWAWTSAVRAGHIESRRLVTDQAIIDAVRARKPGSVLDIGCGEGWLARALSTQGVRVTGIDTIPALVDSAREAGGGDFHCMSYAELAQGALDVQVDMAVCNFSLLGKESVEEVFTAVASLLMPGGALVVQTLHPVVACGHLPYEDGWREGSWAGFGAQFTDPAPWYFRTLESWTQLIEESGFTLREMQEPQHPHTGAPASVIFIVEMEGQG